MAKPDHRVDSVRIDRLIVDNFRSIKHCDVTLGDLTFLAGRNGSGKSSILDALQFIQSTLKRGLVAAVAERNGLPAILYRPCTFPAQMKFQVFFSHSSSLNGLLEIHVTASSLNDCAVTLERCQVQSLNAGATEYRVDQGVLSGSLERLPPPPPDRLYLSAISGFTEFQTVYKLLTRLMMSKYSPKTYDFPLVVKNLLEGDPDRRRVVEDYIRLMVPGFVRLDVETAGDREWVAFVESRGGLEQRFYVPQISDGTLYAAELMLDLFQSPPNGGLRLPLLVEEPGGGLHPWAVGVLRSALAEAASDRQIIVTTHSPELLDSPSIAAENLRTVYRDSDGTHVEQLSKNTVALLNEGICTAGELFRRGALSSDNEPELSPLAV